MPGFVILTNRKRAIVALVHTVVFLALAGYTASLTIYPLRKASPTPAWIMAGVYLVVSAILTVLTAVSGNARERLYFGFCTTSAALGLCRQIAGDQWLDQWLYAAASIRVALLACAVLTGFGILRASTARR